MKNAVTILFVCLSVVILHGCASKSRVVFVTVTQLDIGYDASSGTANLGFNRDENVIGPVYTDTGGVPPVYALLRSSGSLLDPAVEQVYATGDAARRATSGKSNPCPKLTRKDRPLTGPRRLAIFGTSTNMGFKVQFVQNVPESVNLGYKRKEFSWVPLRKQDPLDEDEPDEYASLLAWVGIETDVTSAAAVKQPQSGSKSKAFGINQFIATGDAANNLACSDKIRDEFEVIAGKALEQVEQAAEDGNAARAGNEAGRDQ